MAAATVPASGVASEAGGVSSAVAGPVVSGASAPSGVTVMIGEPTSTVSPSDASSSATTPSNGQGSSTTDLAVSISTMVCPSCTVSPTATCHLTMSASVSPSPTSGSLN